MIFHDGEASCSEGESAALMSVFQTPANSAFPTLILRPQSTPNGDSRPLAAANSLHPAPCRPLTPSPCEGDGIGSDPCRPRVFRIVIIHPEPGPICALGPVQPSSPSMRLPSGNVSILFQEKPALLDLCWVRQGMRVTPLRILRRGPYLRTCAVNGRGGNRILWPRPLRQAWPRLHPKARPSGRRWAT